MVKTYDFDFCRIPFDGFIHIIIITHTYIQIFHTICMSMYLRVCVCLCTNKYVITLCVVRDNPTELELRFIVCVDLSFWANLYYSQHPVLNDKKSTKCIRDS